MKVIWSRAWTSYARPPSSSQSASFTRTRIPGRLEERVHCQFTMHFAEMDFPYLTYTLPSCTKNSGRGSVMCLSTR